MFLSNDCYRKKETRTIRFLYVLRVNDSPVFSLAASSKPYLFVLSMKFFCFRDAMTDIDEISENEPDQNKENITMVRVTYLLENKNHRQYVLQAGWTF